MLRARQSPPALPLLAGALVVALALGAPASLAQSPTATDQLQLRPALDGSPGTPPSFLRSRDDTDAQRIGEIPKFGYQSPLGIGAAGFDSTNSGRPKAKSGATKSGAKAKAAPVAKSGRVGRAVLDPAGRAAGATSGAMAVGQPLGAARQPQNWPRQGAPPAGSGFAPAATTEPLRRLPKLDENQFDAVGINVGAFRLRPAVEVGGGYDSNPARTPNGKPSWYAAVAPELLANSNWARHELTAAVRGSYTDYDATPNLSRPALDARVAGRVDVSRYTRLNLEGSYILGTDNPGSPNIQADLRRLPIFTTVGGAAGLVQSFNRLDVSLKGLADRTVYQNSTFMDGSTESNGDRDYNRFGSELRASYELTPGFRPFVELGADKRVHDLAVDRSGFMRDSEGRYVKVGSTFEFTRLLVGDMSLSYHAPPGPHAAGSQRLVDGSLVWSATALTNAADRQNHRQ